MNPLLDPAARLVIGHRGAAAYAPENTLPSFALARELGADAFELDVRVTRDGVPVVLHDPTLDRTTDRPGAVADLSLGEVRAADAGARFTGEAPGARRYAGAGVRVPLLAEVLEAFPDVPILVELKVPRGREAVARVIEEAGAARRCVLAAARGRCLEGLRRAPFASCATGLEIVRLLAGAYARLTPGAVPYGTLSVPERHRGIPVPTRRFIGAAAQLGCSVHVWTVDRPEAARAYWDRGASGIVTNAPDLIREALAGR